MSVTIKDVADYANVAVSTVSRVINNKDRVSLETRQAVSEAIEKLGYVRNNFAASMKSGETRFIVAVVPNIRNEFYTSVIQGVEAFASTQGYYTLVYTTGEAYGKEKETFEGELGHMVDGIILTPSSSDYTLYQKIGKPTVVIDRVIPGSDMYSVCVDNYKGAVLLMEELIKFGHKKIAMVTGSLEFNISIDRMAGYKDTLKRHSIPIREEYICIDNWYEEDGYRMTNQLLELPDPPTAIFAFNNLLCIGCAECLCDRGLVIGKDISLVGFDDSVVARYLGSGITGIRRATNEMGEIGAKMLLAILNNRTEEIAEKNIVLDVDIIRRGSIAKIE